jgi:hypothetical protein
MHSRKKILKKKNKEKNKSFLLIKRKAKVVLKEGDNETGINEKKKRPIINIENSSEIHLENESFQNYTLRPILKLQHELIIKLFHTKIANLNINWNEINNIKKMELVNSQLSRNIQFKNLIIGLIVGHLNETEIEKYLLNTKEFNKRIVQMTIQRVNSTI